MDDNDWQWSEGKRVYERPADFRAVPWGGHKDTFAESVLSYLRQGPMPLAHIAWERGVPPYAVQAMLRALEADGLVQETPRPARPSLWSLAAGVTATWVGDRLVVTGGVPRWSAPDPPGDAAPAPAPRATAKETPAAPAAAVGEPLRKKKPWESDSRFLGFTRREDMALEHRVLEALRTHSATIEGLVLRIGAPEDRVRRAVEVLRSERLIEEDHRPARGWYGWRLDFFTEVDEGQGGIRVWKGWVNPEEEPGQDLAAGRGDAKDATHPRRGDERRKRD